MSIKKLVASIIAVVGISLGIFSGVVMAIEEPRYNLLEKVERFELRGYDSRIVAETIVSGSMKEASSAGFRIIADYIFGNNTIRAGDIKKLELRTPVSIAPISQKISMTAPVGLEPSDGNWRVQFYMPRQFTMDSLPKPNNAAVKLRSIPPRNVAVLRFSGLVSEAKTQDKTAELLAWLEGKQIEPKSEPVLARYNPPWTLPFLRRNEVMVTY